MQKQKLINAIDTMLAGATEQELRTVYIVASQIIRNRKNTIH